MKGNIGNPLQQQQHAQQHKHVAQASSAGTDWIQKVFTEAEMNPPFILQELAGDYFWL